MWLLLQVWHFRISNSLSLMLYVLAGWTCNDINFCMWMWWHEQKPLETHTHTQENAGWMQRDAFPSSRQRDWRRRGRLFSVCDSAADHRFSPSCFLGPAVTGDGGFVWISEPIMKTVRRDFWNSLTGRLTYLQLRGWRGFQVKVSSPCSPVWVQVWAGESGGLSAELRAATIEDS